VDCALGELEKDLFSAFARVDSMILSFFYDGKISKNLCTSGILEENLCTLVFLNSKII
jgi:hypothetical protein